jgi:hypothetical protein
MRALGTKAFLVSIGVPVCLALAPAAFAGTNPATYHMSGDSDYVRGCYRPCQCPLVLLGPVEGTFALSFELSTPDGFDHYAIDDVDWTLTLGGPTTVTGNGTYSVGPGFHRLQLDLVVGGEPIEHFDSDLVPGGGAFPMIDASVNMNDLVCFDTVIRVQAAPLQGPASSFCNASDGALASCPCGNVGNGDAGCDLPQATGGVRLDAISQSVAPNGATLSAEGFPPAAAPAAIVIRSTGLDPGSSVVFGDGLRCVGTSGLTRLGASTAAGGVSTHTFGHGPLAGSGTFYYQLWFRSTPIMFCDPAAAFNLSNGQTLSWP